MDSDYNSNITQTLKTQIGELVWANTILSAQVKKLTEELEQMKKTNV